MRISYPPFLSGRQVDPALHDKHERENAVRQEAFRLWQNDGCPEWPNAEYYWLKAENNVIK